MEINIDLNVDYEEFCFAISHIMHQKKRMDPESFKSYLKECLRTPQYSKYDKAFIAALGMELHFWDFEEVRDYRLGAYMLNPYDFELFDEYTGAEKDSTFLNANQNLKKLGILIEEFEEAV